jgi:hypothetical protein
MVTVCLANSTCAASLACSDASQCTRLALRASRRKGKSFPAHPDARRQQAPHDPERSGAGRVAPALWEREDEIGAVTVTIGGVDPIGAQDNGGAVIVAVRNYDGRREELVKI